MYHHSCDYITTEVQKSYYLTWPPTIFKTESLVDVLDLSRLAVILHKNHTNAAYFTHIFIINLSEM